jgi:hypothetical protein
VAEFLFGLLPYHCRRHLTFSTYDEPRSSASASRAGEAPRAGQLRRLMMTVVHQGSSASQAYLIDVPTRKYEVPPTSSLLAREYAACVDSGDMTKLFGIRDVASQFAFPESDFLSGLEDASRLRILIENKTPRDRADYDLYHRLTLQLRPERRSFRELVDVAHRLIKESPRVLGRDATLWKQLTTDYVQTLTAQFPFVSQYLQGPSGEWPVVQNALQALFLAAFHFEAWPALGTLLAGVSAAAELAPLRNAVLPLLGTRVRERVSQEVVHLLPEFWAAVERSCSQETAEGQQFRTDVSQHLWKVTAEGLDDPRIAPRIDGRFLAILSAARMDQPEELNARLNAVERIRSRVSSGEALQQFWEEAIRIGSIGPDVLAQIARDRWDLLLSSYAVWEKAMRLLGEQQRLIEGPLRDPALATLYWEHPAQEVNSIGSSWHRGLCAALTALQEGRDPEKTDERLVEPYCRQGCQELRRRLTSAFVSTAEQLGEIVAAHCRLIELIQDRLSRGPALRASEGLTLATAHLQDVLAVLCVYFDNLGPPGGDGAWLFPMPLQRVLTICPDVAARTEFFAALAADIWTRRHSTKPTTSVTPLRASFNHALATCRVGAEEASWYGRWFQLGLQSKTQPGIHLLKEVVALFLVDQPELAFESQADDSRGLRQYLRRHLDDLVLEKFKDRVVNRIVSEEVTRLPEAIAKHLAPESPHRRLLESQADRADIEAGTLPPTLWESATLAVVDRVKKLTDPSHVCRALQTLLECHIPGKAESEARGALLDKVDHWCRVVAAKQKAPQSSSVSPDDFVWVKSMLEILAWVAADLRIEELQGIWDLLSRCLYYFLREATLAKYFPSIFRIGEALQVHFDEAMRPGIWRWLFRPVGFQADEHTRLQLFVAAGDSLCTSGATRHRLVERLKYWRQLRTLEESKNWFNPHASSASQWWRRRLTFRRDAQDLLERELGCLPRDPPTQQQRVIARAQFAAAMYSTPDARLAGIYGVLGDASSTHEHTGSALAGYIALDGPTRAVERARKLCEYRKFWAVLRQRRGKDAGVICDQVEKVLREQEGVWEASDIARQIRKKFRRLVFWR